MRALEEIEVDANAATEGPWQVDDEFVATDDGDGWIVRIESSSELLSDQGRADLKFIAAARTDVPDLIAALREKTAESAQFQSMNDGAHVMINEDLLPRVTALEQALVQAIGFIMLARQHLRATPSQQYESLGGHLLDRLSMVVHGQPVGKVLADARERVAMVLNDRSGFRVDAETRNELLDDVIVAAWTAIR